MYRPKYKNLIFWLIYVYVGNSMSKLTLHNLQRNNSFSNDSGNFSIRQSGEISSASFHKSAAAAAEMSFFHGRSSSPTQQSNTATAKSVLSDLR